MTPSPTEPRRLAYADPPYPGNAYLYAGHPDYDGEVDHAELLDRLQTYDGWALSTSSKALASLLPYCPPDIRLLAWMTHSVGRSWEPVIVSPARRLPTQYQPLDWLLAEVEAYQWRPRPDDYVIGRKPPEFCRWIFRWLGARAGEGDELDDLYPGSGAVSAAWEEWNTQPELPRMAVGRRDVRRWRRDRPGWLAIDIEEM